MQPHKTLCCDLVRGAFFSGFEVIHWDLNHPTLWMCIEIRSNHFKDCSLIEDLRNGRPCPLHTHFSSLVSQRPHEQIVFTPSPVMMVALYLVLENIKHVEFS